jgi:drug/metabolite transporter (DMT)-like permease
VTVQQSARRALRSPAALATTLLVGVTAVWGSTFVVVKDAVDRMPVMDFLAIRFAVAALVMIALRPKSLLRLGKVGWRRGVALGLALGIGYVAQTFGLQRTPASISGFITGMFVVFTPLISALVLRRRVGGYAWLGVAIATGGLALLSLHGFSIGSGELLTLACALLFAVHIVGLGEWSSKEDTYALAVAQLLTVAVLCTVVAAPSGLVLPPDAGVWGAVALTALLATAAAFVIQTWAQTVLSPTRTAVIMTMEPVFAGIFGVLLASERLGIREFAGAALVVGAMYLVELGPRRSAEGTFEHLE